VLLLVIFSILSLLGLSGIALVLMDDYFMGIICGICYEVLLLFVLLSKFYPDMV